MLFPRMGTDEGRDLVCQQSFRNHCHHHWHHCYRRHHRSHQPSHHHHPHRHHHHRRRHIIIIRHHQYHHIPNLTAYYVPGTILSPQRALTPPSDFSPYTLFHFSSWHIALRGITLYLYLFIGVLLPPSLSCSECKLRKGFVCFIDSGTPRT